MKGVADEGAVRERMAQEGKILEKRDEKGNTWRKVYFGGGAHFRNWLDQFLELRGEDNVEVEETDSSEFQCYHESSEKMYRIWVKESNSAHSQRDQIPMPALVME
jgi:hypothetical protein